MRVALGHAEDTDFQFFVSEWKLIGHSDTSFSYIFRNNILLSLYRIQR